MVFFDKLIGFIKSLKIDMFDLIKSHFTEEEGIVLFSKSQNQIVKSSSRVSYTMVQYPGIHYHLKLEI